MILKGSFCSSFLTSGGACVTFGPLPRWSSGLELRFDVMQGVEEENKKQKEARYHACT